VELANAAPLQWFSSLLSFVKRHEEGEQGSQSSYGGIEIVWGAFENVSSEGGVGLPPPPPSSSGRGLNFSPNPLLPISSQPYCACCCSKIRPPSLQDLPSTLPVKPPSSAPPVNNTPLSLASSIFSFWGGGTMNSSAPSHDQLGPNGKQRILLGLCKSCITSLREIGLILM